MKQWLDPQPIDIPDDLQQVVGGHRIVAESLVRRGFTSPQAAQQFLSTDAYSPTPADELPDMQKAVDGLSHAIKTKQRILVWGDFDVDGQTSTALLVSALQALNANVTYYVPNRFSDGHGIHLPTLKQKLDNIDILLTCDTGIAAHDSVDYAKSLGVITIITDHHSLPPTLPDADAIINPMRLPDGHPLRELPGVGTAYKLMESLYEKHNQSAEHLLDLVAMGIVADVMVQVDDTRYLLQRGLDILRHSPRTGLKVMMERAGITPSDLTESDIGFSLAPRLNALGRLGDANPAVELLTTDDNAIIAERVNELEGLNQTRKYLTRQVYAAAQAQIKSDPSLLKYAALVLAQDDWHTGVVGIVASRLVEDYDCPVILLSTKDGIARGSARSVDGCNIVEAIRSQEHLINTYGGHNMAAGLSMDANNLFEFRRGLSGIVREMLGKAEVQPELAIDAYITLDEINLEFAEDIARLAPFGNGNPPLTLATKNVKIKSRRTLGNRGDHLDIRVEDESGNEQRIVWWFGDVSALPEGWFDIAYTVRPNVYKGKREAMVEWIDTRPSADKPIEVASKPTYEIIDYRKHANPSDKIREVVAEYPEAIVFSEGDKTVDGVNRYALSPAEILIVWTIPASLTEWRAIISEVQPQQIVLFGAHQADTSPQALLQIIAGMVKYALNNRYGLITVQDIATYTAHSELTIRNALRVVAAKTNHDLKPISEDTFSIEPNSETTTQSQAALQQLQYILRETHAYHRYWLNSQELV